MLVRLNNRNIIRSSIIQTKKYKKEQFYKRMQEAGREWNSTALSGSVFFIYNGGTINYLILVFMIHFFNMR